MNASDLIDVVKVPADSCGTRVQPAVGPLGITRHISWWRWGKDDDADSIVATITTAKPAEVGKSITMLRFAPTCLVFTQGGTLLKGHSVSSRPECVVFYPNGAPEAVIGIDDAVRSYTLFPDHELPSDPAA